MTRQLRHGLPAPRALRQMCLDQRPRVGRERAVHVLVQLGFPVAAPHLLNASRNSRRARNSCAFDVPTAIPVSSAIS